MLFPPGQEVRETLDPIFRPDPLPEDMWYQEPLSPEQAEYLKMKAQNSQSAMAKGGVPVQVQKTVTPETVQSQVPVVQPKKPVSVGQEETSKSQRPVPHPENMAKAGKETVKSHPASPRPKDMAKIGKETSESQSDQEPRVPGEKSNASCMKWSDDVTASDEAYTSIHRQRNDQSIADRSKGVRPILKTYSKTNKDGVQNTPRVEQPRRAELTRCCFQRIDNDQEASMHVWNQFLSKWATANHTEEPWYIRVSADKNYLFFGEDGIDMEPLLSMCPSGAHLHSEYVGGNDDGPRMLRIGIYLKAPTYGPMINRPAEGRVTGGHEVSMVSMFFALVDWSIRVTMGVECPFSTLLKSHHLEFAHKFSKSMEKVVATATKLAKVQLESQARAEEAERSRQEESAREEAAKERHAKKLQDETAHIEKSTRDILRSYENDEVKCRQGLKILIAETDEFVQDDAQRWAIIVNYISRDWPDKADWASELMSKQGYGEARPT